MSLPVWAQNANVSNKGDASYIDPNNQKKNSRVWGRDTTKKDKPIPIGLYQWKVDQRLGNIISAENTDTAVHNFQNWKLADGMNGEYSFLGTNGSPRLSRIFINRKYDNTFMFQTPLDQFGGCLSDFLYTNTKSPITNLAWHFNPGAGDGGEDRIHAYFATNINKRSGIGFKMDYNYARGCYTSQQVSQFGGIFYGYYLGERYNMHTYINFNHWKRAENEGIADNNYIEHPDAFSRSVSSRDIPVNVSGIWNRDDNQTYFLTQRFHFGYRKEIEVPDSMKPKMPSDAEFYFDLPDSVREVLDKDSLLRRTTLDSLRQDWTDKLIPPTEFIPVASIIHTLQIRHMLHRFYDEQDNSEFYAKDLYPFTTKDDDAGMLSVRNTVGLSMNEGFRKWVKMSLVFYATHEYRKYTLPYLDADKDSLYSSKAIENDILVGGQMSKKNGHLLHYNVNGEVCVIGPNIGNVDINAAGDLNFKFTKKDSIRLDVSGFFKNERPQYFMRHYRNANIEWDNDDLSREIRFGVRADLTYSRTKSKLFFGFDNIKNYTYLGMKNTLKEGKDASSILPGDYLHDIAVNQYYSNVQVLTAGLIQKLGWKIFHLDLEGTFQHSTNQDVLPLPKFNAYGNAYLLFRIGFGKVLRIQLGTDVRYFTSYYAPGYSGALGLYATQDTDHPRMKVGNYPVVNAYANFHLKHCRFYVNVTHVNAGHGHSFLVPYMPLNPLMVNLGISWNFFN